MLVSGKSFLHYCYSMQTEDGSRSHLKLGTCLLISAEMPERFLLQYTAMAHLLIIQEECCGFLMYCCRAFFWCNFPVVCSVLFAPLRLFPAASGTASVNPTYFCCFKNSKDFAPWFSTQHSVCRCAYVWVRCCVCMVFFLHLILQWWKERKESPHSHPSMSALLIVWAINYSYLDPAGTQQSVPKIKSSNCFPMNAIITLFKVTFCSHKRA